MKTKFASFLTFLILFLSIMSFAQKPVTEKTPKNNFFTEADASNWAYVIKDKTLAPTQVFIMKDGILQISGTSSGYLRTKKNYADYELNVEWRWTKMLGNSGVLVHIQAKDTIWPACYQVQQKADAAGDIICMNGLWAKECKDSVKFTVNKLQTSNEKALGEWNTMRVICMKNTLKVYVNGLLQNNITGLTATKGFIGFQNEGKPLEFRNLTIH
jgi:hypothetical protein